MTEEQLHRVSKNSKNFGNDGRNMIYCYDIDSNYTYIAVSLVALGNILKTKFFTSQLRNKVVRNKYVLARTPEQLEDKKKIAKKSLAYKLQFTEELYTDIISMSYKDFMLKYKVCKKTYYNYRLLFKN